MPKIANVLREEITRISRREIKKQSAVLQRSSAQFRRDIARLKREVASLQRSLKQKNRADQPKLVAADADASSMRFVAKGFRSLRHRLGLSAAQMGKLLKVSEQSVYNWETKAAVPRRTHLPAIAHLRGLGKRQASALLDQKS